MKNKCKCGCGQLVKKDNIFIRGHNSRVKGYYGGQFKKGRIPWIKGKTKENNKIVFEASIKSSKSHRGKIPSNIKQLIRLNKSNIKERITKILKRKPISYFERKIINLIKHNNLPYKFVGDGSFWLGNRNPDFINTNGEKKLIEVYGSFQKKRNYGSVKKYENHRIQHYKAYGFKVIFINEKQLLNKNWDKLCLFKIKGE